MREKRRGDLLGISNAGLAVAYLAENRVKRAFTVKVVVSNSAFRIHYVPVVVNVLVGGNDVDQNLFLLIAQPLDYVNSLHAVTVETLVALAVREKPVVVLSYEKAEAVNYVTVVTKVALHVVFYVSSKESDKHLPCVMLEVPPITIKNVMVVT